MSKKAIVVISTASSEKEGGKIAQHLVEKKLAACVSVIPRVKSFFYWEGKLCQEKEAMLFIKTVEGKLKRLINEIKKIHSYEVPEIIFLKVDGGEKDYLQWIEKALAEK